MPQDQVVDLFQPVQREFVIIAGDFLHGLEHARDILARKFTLVGIFERFRSGIKELRIAQFLERVRGNVGGGNERLGE